jgi:outer membrane protein assembly factor BamB
MVYVNDDYLTAYDAQTGALRWRLTQQVGRARQLLAPKDGVLFVVPDATLPSALLAIDDRTGTIKWSFEPTADQNQPYPLQVIGDTVYVPYGDGAQFQSEYLPSYGNQGVSRLYALDRATGAVKWHYDQPDFAQNYYSTSRITLPIAEWNGVVYVTAWLSSGPSQSYSDLRSSTLFRLNAATGAVLSTTTLMVTHGGGDYAHVGELLTGASVANGRVYLPTGANQVYALQPR